MEVYIAHPTTMIDTGKTRLFNDQKDRNPLYEPEKEGSLEFSLPKFESLSEPLPCCENEVNVLQPDKSFKIEKDFRGTKYWEQDGTEKEIEKIGEEVPEGVLLISPPEFSNAHDGTNWIVDYEKMREYRLNTASETRQIVEISGANITGVSCADFMLATDNTGQTKVLGSAFAASLEPESVAKTKWKTMSGWREVSNEDIMIMAFSVRAYMNSTFARLEAIEEEIKELEDSKISDYVIDFTPILTL